MSLTDALLREAYPLDVWIALRPDSARGSGSEDDPFDGSTRPEAAFNVTGLSYSGREATATTATDPGYTDGDVITIAGVTGAGAGQFNGSFPIYGKSGTTFKYWMSAVPGGAAQGTNWTAARQVFRFDDLMKNTVGANVAVHLGPGVFETRGSSVWQPKSGQKLRGSGIAVTTLRLVGVNVPYFPVNAIGYQYDNYLDSFEASDFTVDCNLPGQILKDTQQNFALAPVTCGAVFIVGQHLRLRRLRAINFGTQGPFGQSTPHPNDPNYPNEKPSNECFVLSAAWPHPNLESLNPPKTVSDCVIEDCILEQPSLNNARETTCICLGASERGASDPFDGKDGLMAYHRGCVVRNCVVDCEYKDNPVSIQSVTSSLTTTATVTTRLPHGRETNDWVRISGAVVNGSTDNPYNGSFKITKLSPTTFQYTISSAVPDPTGDMWVGRWPSHFVAVTSIQKSGSGPWVFTVSTATPHFLVPKGAAVLTNVTNSDAGKPPTAFNVTWVVKDILDRKTFTFEAASDPGSPVAVSNTTLGVNFQAVTIDGGSEAVMEGCHILNCGYGGPYHDTWSTKDLTVRNNHYRAVLIGPYQLMGGTGRRIGAPSLTYDNLPGSGPHLATFQIVQTSPTVVPHRLAVGQGVHIIDATVGGTLSPYYNGYFRIESVSETTFTYWMTGNPQGPADGGTPKAIALWQVGQCVIENNVIELMPAFNNWGPPCGIAFAGAPQDPLFNSIPGAPVRVFRRAVIRNNIIRFVETVTQGAGSERGISLNGCENVLLEHNVSDATILTPIAWVNCSNLRVFNNRSPAGQLIPVQGVVMLTDFSTVKRDDLSKVIEDAAILAML